MRLPSGNALQRWVLPILAVAAAAQIAALWYVNGKTATSTQHSLNTQQSEIGRGGITVQQAQAEINALTLDIRGLQATVNSLRGTNGAQEAENANLQNQITALGQAINQIGSSSTNGSGSSGSVPPPSRPSATLPPCHGNAKHC